MRRLTWEGEHWCEQEVSTQKDFGNVCAACGANLVSKEVGIFFARRGVTGAAQAKLCVRHFVTRVDERLGLAAGSTLELRMWNAEKALWVTMAQHDAERL